MSKLSKYSDAELREELDRRTRRVMNENGRVRCKDCLQPDGCKFRKKLKLGVWRVCEDYIENEITID